jgi:very-short-patch-repair endonuclease
MATGAIASSDSILRRFARDQWVRIHGTPRVTVLAGHRSRARALWEQWVALRDGGGTLLDDESHVLEHGTAARPAVGFDARVGTPDIDTRAVARDIDALLRAAVAKALALPEHPIAVVAAHEAILVWRRGRSDRVAAMVDEGLLVIDALDDATGARRSHPDFDARSAAEAALFEALEATKATAGRFELNESLSVCFGPSAAEVDLLSRCDRIAIELDGYHHFSDIERYRRDRRKDLLMQTEGLLVLRFLAEDVVNDPREAVNAVCQALAYRRGEQQR